MARTRRNHSSKFLIWQWNCRGYRRKRGNLQQHLLSMGLEGAPDVIALQETNGQAKLPGFKSFIPVDGAQGEEPFILVTTLVKRNIPVIQHTTGIHGADHVLLEIISTSGLNRGNLFILNVYSSPRKNHRFSQLLRKTASLAGSRTPLLVVGDFNAPHFAWGYDRCTAKGSRLWLDAQQEHLTLLTDPVQPTRQGTATSNNTTREEHRPARYLE